MVKNGTRRNLIRYKCKNCNKQFQSKHKKQKLNRNIFKSYTLGKQTLVQLSEKMHLSIPIIQKHLDNFTPPQSKLIPRAIILVLDATYFGDKKAKDGLLVGKDWLTKKPVYYKFIQTETKLVYLEARQYLEDLGFHILAVVVDGRPGIRNVFKDLPLQMCQFHQIQIVNRYLTKNPKLLPSIQLKTIVEELTRVKRHTFESRFNYWLETNQVFLDEKSINSDTKRNVYKHKKLRSAVNSIKTNLPFLFTFQEERIPNIPNTTNCLDGWFAHLKKLVHCHNVLRKDRRNKLIEYILSSQNFN